MTQFTIPGLTDKQGARLAELLQKQLSTYNDLHLTLKHIHWNVVGPSFIGVQPATYTDANGVVFKKYGARILVRGGQHEAAEGKARSRNVVLEFKDYATALEAFHSPEYQKLAAVRKLESATIQ